MATPHDHWAHVYGSRSATDVSWFRPHLDISLAMIDEAKLPSTARIIDVGGGASTLVDDLLGRGFDAITVLDIAGKALAAARVRLGSLADRVTWMEADATRINLPAASFDLWHDRAVFHFLTDPSDRSRYIANATTTIKPGGRLIIAAFGPDGPTQCSGLDVVRYDAARLAAEFAEAFELIDSRSETHVTPGGSEQGFLYCLMAKR